MTYEPVHTFLENLAQNGLEHFRVFYGEYRAFVERNDDPEGRGRIQVSVPGWAPTIIEAWIDPDHHSSGPDRGSFWPSEVGDTVWVTFERGRIDSPCTYRNGWHGEDDVPGEFEYEGPAPTGVKGPSPTPTRRGWVTRGGHHLVFDDTPGAEAVSLVWHKPSEPNFGIDLKSSSDRGKGDVSTLLFRDDGSVSMSSSIGQFFEMDATNGVVTIGAPSAKGEPAAMITINKAGIFMFDKNGSNQIFIDDGVINIISPGDITLNGKSFNAKTGGQFLGNGASEPVVLGQTYTTARGAMNQQVASTFTLVGAGAEATAGALKGLAAAPIIGPLATALIPFFELVAKNFTPTGAAVAQFEAKGVTYLSRKTKTA